MKKTTTTMTTIESRDHSLVRDVYAAGLRKVAKAARISPSTLSRWLNRKIPMSSELAERVVKAVREN